ncbi:tyrosinase-like [Branchiostoma floridae]|uniref:Tyrosinase n=1 Tax=Branchiostoma floridae TaxID=7739 RepID=A0A9J7MHH6_BRAFL|nr:tyrosinase-like [Branchiostoma floridae]
MKALGLLIVLVVIFSRGDAQFPRVCISDDLLEIKECCPIPQGFTEPCGGPGRGHCNDTHIPDVENSVRINEYEVDDRRRWPTVFFGRTCACEGNFMGYDCTRCIWGYSGDDCSIKQKPAVRKNILNLNDEERSKFQRYFNNTKYTTSDFVYALEFKENIRGSQDFASLSVWDFFMATHYYASRATMPPASAEICKEKNECFLDFAHEGVGFPTWHRAYVLEFERAVQEVNDDSDWTLPYWDWSAAEDNQCDICTNDYVGKNDPDGNLDTGSVFANWETICVDLPSFDEATNRTHTKPCNVTEGTGKLKRNPGNADTDSLGESMARLPYTTEVDFALRFSTYDTPPYGRISDCSFRNLLEGYADTSTGKNRQTTTNGTVTVPGAHTLHNHVHIYLDGTMSDVPSAANDPIFFLHHCNVDRLFETWIRRYGTNDLINNQPETGASPGHSRNEYIVPIFPPYSHATIFKRSTELGYDYQELHEEGTDGGSDMGECGVAAQSGVSPRVIGMAVGITLGLVLLAVAVVLFILYGPKMPPRQVEDTGTEMSVQT